MDFLKKKKRHRIYVSVLSNRSIKGRSLLSLLWFKFQPRGSYKLDSYIKKNPVLRSVIDEESGRITTLDIQDIHT